jgi:hypothetical protein
VLVAVLYNVHGSTAYALYQISLEDVNLWLYAVLVGAILAKVTCKQLCSALEWILNETTESRINKFILDTLDFDKNGFLSTDFAARLY